jgi:diaminopimelate epimerase
MSHRIELAKLHATGNDFLVTAGTLGSNEARALCDRRRGIGADGVIVLGPGVDGADVTMTLHNADGGIAEMSGNGVRCLAWVAHRAGLGGDRRLVVETGGGRRALDLTLGAAGDVAYASCDMGPVTFDPEAIPTTASSPFGMKATYHGTDYEGDAAGVGNPHLVLFVDDPVTARVTQHGPHLEQDERFPNGVNVEFVAPVADELDTLAMRVWERGVGETLSCGTGACAAAAAAHRRGLVGDHVTVRVPGGDLTVVLGDTVQLGGPVVHVFNVAVDLDLLGDTA